MAEISTGFIPRKFQLELRAKLKRFNVIVCHRRFGKTVFSLNHTLDHAVRNNNPMPRYHYVAPTYGQAKRVAWDYLKKYASPLPGYNPNEADLRVDLEHNQSRLQLLSAEKPESNKGIYSDGCTLDEFASQPPSMWTETMRPLLTDRRGWCNFIGTPKGSNKFRELYEYATGSGDPEWFGAMYKASETGIISQEELDSARRTMPEEEYEQEFECSFSAGLSGAYFVKELTKAEKDGRIGSVPHDPMLPVDLYFDLGIDDLTSVWFVQSLRGNHHVVDYYEVCGASIGEIVGEIKKKPYALGEWVLPHDANARDLSTGKAQIQVFYSLGCRPVRIVPRVGSKRESINAARMVFGQCRFDKEKCRLGLKALENYQRQWNEKNLVYSETPLHNWASNGSDAFQTFAMGTRKDSRDTLDSDRRYGGGQTVADMSYNPFQRRES